MPTAPVKKTAKPVIAMPKKKHVSHAPAHAVTWMAVLAIVFSGATLTLAASAATISTCNQNSIAGVRCLIGQLSDKIDALNHKLDVVGASCGNGVCTPPANSPSTSVGGTGTNNIIRDNTAPAGSDNTLAPAKAFGAPVIDVTKCKQACEDEFNACAKKAGADDKLYSACKPPYEACNTSCGQ